MGKKKKVKALRKAIEDLGADAEMYLMYYGGHVDDNGDVIGSDEQYETTLEKQALAQAQECDCDKCGLLEDTLGPVPDDGGDYTILVVGEAPGELEDEKGIPFVGRSGELLRTVLTELKFPMDKVTFTNIVRCRPPNNKISKRYINCCYAGLPIEPNTELVMLMGNTPLQAVLGEKGITAWNGTIVERDGIMYAPLYHPAYILRNGQASDDWLQAIIKVLDAWTGGMEDAADAHYEYITSVYNTQAIADMCAELLASPIISFDTEVACLDAYDDSNRLLVMSFATKDTAWSVPIDHPDDLCALQPIAAKHIHNVLETHPYIVGHNVKFDQMQVRAMFGTNFDAGGDSMLLSFLHKSVRGQHGLKHLAGYHLGMFDYDRKLGQYIEQHADANPAKDGSYANIPLYVLEPYAGMDAAAAYLLHEKQYDVVTDKQRILYEELVMPASNALARMQCNGIAVDYDIAERYFRLYSTALENELDNILGDRKVQAFVQARREHATTKADREFEFNPGSWQHKAVVLYHDNYCNFAVGKPWFERTDNRTISYQFQPAKISDSGNPSTSRDAIKGLRNKCSLVDSFVMHGMLSKMLGTYIEPIHTGRYASSDGRIRASFNMHTVATGRLSSNNPNMQNIPTPEKEPDTILQYQPIKNMFTHTWDGGCLLCVDYSGMELRVFASLAKCGPMLDIHKSGQDFHSMVGSMVSGLPVAQITKEMRYRYKWTNWTLLYGGGAGTLNKMYGIPYDEAQATVDDYYARFPEVLDYREECEDFTLTYGYIETPYGRRRPLPNINDPQIGRQNAARRAAVNTPVQSAASDTLLLALVIIDDYMRTVGYKSMLVNTVHDSIVFDVYPGELDSLVELCVDVMENVLLYAREYAHNINMDWLICPLKADVEVGTHYGAMDHYEVRR